jgi:hypothetical protein
MRLFRILLELFHVKRKDEKFSPRLYVVKDPPEIPYSALYKMFVEKRKKKE